MKITALLISLYISAASAAPALIWKELEPVSLVETAHHSNDVSFEKVMEDAFSSSGDQLNVVFVLGRSDNGEETLTSMTASGALPGVDAKAESACAVHHHVSDVQNAESVTTMANRAANQKALKISLDEFANKLDTLAQPQIMEVESNGMVSKAVHAANKRSRALKEARTLVVDIPAKTNSGDLDAAVVRAIDSKDVGSVVLSSVRSVAEVKHAREMQAHYRRLLMEQEGKKIMEAREQRRRLNDNADGGNQQQQEVDISDVIYVSMTPNIFAGLLFMLLFAVISLIGLGCMGAIQGQDVYVSKMPSVGREA